MVAGLWLISITMMQNPNFFTRFIPFLIWLPDTACLARMDIIAGLLSVALLVLEGMAFAQLAGVPPEITFYTVLIE